MTPDSQSLLEEFGAFVEASVGLSFSPTRWNDLRRATEEMARAEHFQSAGDCMRSMMGFGANHATMQTLGRHLSNGETFFFRDAATFSVLRLEILPRLIAARRESGVKALRILSAGCCTGEEAYSLAMLAHDLPGMADWDVRVAGVDFNPAFLQVAQAGTYGAWSFRGVPETLRLRHFEPAGDARFAVLPAIRGRVDFRYANLAGDDYGILGDMAPFDLVLCKNVLMYFGAKPWRRAVARMHGLLAADGWLCVSPIESDRELYPQYQPIEFEGQVFFRKADV